MLEQNEKINGKTRQIVKVQQPQKVSMYLKKLKLKNFRCFNDFEIDDIGKLAVFIGENDAGKTVLLNAVKWLLNDSACEESDCRKLKNGRIEKEVSVEGIFEVEDFDKLPSVYRGGENKEFHLIKRHSSNGTEILCRISNPLISASSGKKPFEERLLLRRYSNSSDDGKKKRDEVAEYNKIKNFLPEVDFVSAADYDAPNRLIEKRLRSTAARMLNRETADGEMRKLLKSLDKIKEKIQAELNDEIVAASKTLTRHNRKFKKIIAEPIIDFSKSVTLDSLILDLDDGERHFDQFGDGTKRRLWMGLLEWESDSRNDKDTRTIIRLYDEPDVNLHYKAQRDFFDNILEISQEENSKTQSFISTHSFPMIDRAPTESICFINSDQSGNREAKRMSISSTNAEVVSFFHEIGQTVGLSNTALIFERGFLLVEGKTEAVLLPTLYERFYGNSMARDGIKLINLYGCSSWQSVLETLLENRLNSVHFLLDTDCKSENSGSNIHKELKKNSKYANTVIKNQITFAGQYELEDSFSDDVLRQTLESVFPHSDNSYWQIFDFNSLRGEDKKFSDLLLELVKNQISSVRHKPSKPEFATHLAKYCTPERIPDAVIEAFNKLRERIGLPEKHKSRNITKTKTSN